MTKINFRNIEPHNFLIAVCCLTALPFLIVQLFNEQLYGVVGVSSYLVFHNVIELFSIMVSLSIFGLGWFAFDQSRDRHALFLSVTFLAIGLMDGMHTLSYSGMPALITPNSVNKSTQFWIAVRFLGAVAFLGSGFILPEHDYVWLKKPPLMVSALFIAMLVFAGVTFFQAYLPETYIIGVGLTPFKKIAEYVIIVVLMLAVAACWRRLKISQDQRCHYYMAAFVLCIASELAFTAYKSAFDTFNMLGHIYKLLAFILIYNGIFTTAVKKPYDELSGAIAKLEEALKFNQEIINSAREGIIVCDLNLRIIIWNPFMEEISGFTSAYVLGKHTLELFPFHEETGHLDHLKMALAGEPAPIAEFHFEIAATGKSGWASEASAPLRNASGEITGVISTVRDITEQRKVEDQLRQAQKLESLGRLSGGVAHDFNNKLTVIMGYAELVRMHFTDPELHCHIKEIVRAAEQSRDITSQLLAFSRQQAVSPSSVNINSILADLRKSLGRLIGEDIRTEFIPGENLWNICIDPVQFDQIIMNLAVNARDAMPDGGAITIKTANTMVTREMATLHNVKSGEYVRFTFQDSGTGMDSETIKHIFEPFFTTKDHGKGTGLGLATIYGIVAQNGGFIDVESTIGCGTAFIIYLPHNDFTDYFGNSDNQTDLAQVTGNILLVEDEEPIRKMTQTMLESLGYTCIAAIGPNEALELVRDLNNNFDLVLTDVVMPKMNGKEMVKQIQEVRPKIKWIYMSGFAADIVPGNAASVDESLFIRKPFKMDDLAKVIQSALRAVLH